MFGPSRELGAVKATAIVVTLAITALGGVAYMLTGNVPFVTGKTTQPAAVEFVQPVGPIVANPVKSVSDDDELKRVKKGQMAQFRDKAGNLMLRSNTPVMGKTGDGRQIQFNLEARASLVPLTKGKDLGSKTEMAKHKKSGAGGKSPLKFASTNGRLTPMGGAKDGEKPAGEGGK